MRVPGASVTTLAVVLLAGCNASYPFSPSVPEMVGVRIFTTSPLGPVPLGTSFNLVAYALNSEGAYEDVTATTVWSISDASLISRSPYTTVSFASFVGIGVGTTVVTAEYAGFSNSVTVATYRRDRPVYPMLTLTGGNPLNIGRSESARAALQRGASESLDVTSLARWSSSDAAVATVTSQGNVLANGPGTALITASYDGVSGWYFMSVVPDRSISR